MKKLTVTIGIPAHNEEQNIKFLLESILKQKRETYVLEKIIVICDGCTDNTENKVIEISKKFPFIQVLNDKQRKGQTQRLNQLYQLNTSDIIIAFDGDTVLGNLNVIENLVNKFTDKKTVIVAGNNQPIEAETLIEIIINRWNKIWYEIRKDFNNGNNIHNLQGSATALRKSFAKSIKYPADIVANQNFLYISIYKRKLKFKFANDAIVYYRSPNSIADFNSQAGRTSKEKYQIASYFGDSVWALYRIPASRKIFVILKNLIKNPLSTFLSISFFLFFLINGKNKYNLGKKGMWAPVESTKKQINIKL